VQLKDRRGLLRRGLQIASAAAAVGLLPYAVRAADKCEDPASESLRNSLHYTDNAADPKKACQLCGFFNAQDDKRPCGNCMIMTGPVNAKGHCDSWSAKG
jgi:hypothetical protein